MVYYCVQEQQEEWVKKLKFHASLPPAQQLTSYSSLGNMSRPITENLNAVLQLLQYSAVRACLGVGWQSAAVLVRLPLGIQLAADSPPPACAPADQRTVVIGQPEACRHAARPPALPGWRQPDQ